MKQAFLAALVAGIALPAYAANIEVRGDKVYLMGTIELGDDEKFKKAIEPHDRPMTVVLHSMGGMSGPAYRIARLINARDWNTHVEFVCHSACTIIWLGGVRLSKTENALIGFHSASDFNFKKMSPQGNALNAEFISSLGYSREVGWYGRSSLAYTYLTPSDAKRLGIHMTIVPPSIPKQTFASINLHKQPDLPKAVFDPANTRAIQRETERLRYALGERKETPAQTITPSNSDWIIQIGVFAVEHEARNTVNAVRANLGEKLKDAIPVVERVVMADKSLYRARFAGMQREQAAAICRQLKRNDIPCMYILTPSPQPSSPLPATPMVTLPDDPKLDSDSLRQKAEELAEKRIAPPQAVPVDKDP